MMLKNDDDFKRNFENQMEWGDTILFGYCERLLNKPKKRWTISFLHYFSRSEYNDLWIDFEGGSITPNAPLYKTDKPFGFTLWKDIVSSRFEYDHLPSYEEFEDACFRFYEFKPVQMSLFDL